MPSEGDHAEQGRQAPPLTSGFCVFCPDKQGKSQWFHEISEDGKVWNLPVILQGGLGSSLFKFSTNPKKFAGKTLCHEHTRENSEKWRKLQIEENSGKDPNFPSGPVMFPDPKFPPPDMTKLTQWTKFYPAGVTGVLTFETGVSLVPHAKKSRGEDAFFVADNRMALGVADGVGGWASFDVQPHLFPEALMQKCKEVLDSKQGSISALEALSIGFEASKNVMGSSTACVIVLNESGTGLSSVCIGDSGFRLFREGNMIYKSLGQEHSPNQPYQLGTDSKDLPKDGVIADLEVKEGDIIFIGSDGLFDNLFDDEITAMIRPLFADKNDKKLTKSPRTSPRATLCLSGVHKIAEDIAQRAFMVTQTKGASSPYAFEQYCLGREYQGGKSDDITALIAILRKVN